MSIKVLLCFLFLSGCASANNWTTHDTYRHIALTGLKAVDMMQTLKIADNPDRYYERNPILGDHPSREEVLAYFGVSYLAVTTAAIFLPPEIRPYLQYAVIGVSAACVGNNLSIGLGMGF